MKKVIRIAAFAVLGMVALSSCKKDYTCTCTATVGEISSSASTTLNATKADAKEACEAGSTTGVVCSID